MVWLYVPDMEASNWELNESLMITEPFVMWRGKPLQLNTLSKKWKKVSWMKRLSGLTLEPSKASLGVEKWILSREDFHASPTQLLESKWPTKTQETYGPILSELLGKCDLDSYSLKTFQESLNGDLTKLSLTSTNWGIMLHGVLWRLRTLARCIKENDGSFLESGMIPTPTTQANAQVRGQYKTNGTTLAGYVKMFPTPTARESNDLGGSMERHQRLGREKETLTRMISGEEGLTHGGKLSPQWVAWLMGLPIGLINSDY